jgi:hypothetical protein
MKSWQKEKLLSICCWSHAWNYIYDLLWTETANPRVSKVIRKMVMAVSQITDGTTVSVVNLRRWINAKIQNEYINSHYSFIKSLFIFTLSNKFGFFPLKTEQLLVLEIVFLSGKIWLVPCHWYNSTRRSSPRPQTIFGDFVNILCWFFAPKNGSFNFAFRYFDV